MIKKHNLDDWFLTNQDLFFTVHNPMSDIEADRTCIKFPCNKHVYLFTKFRENDTPCSLPTEAATESALARTYHRSDHLLRAQ